MASAITKGVSTRQDVENALVPWPAEAVMLRRLNRSQVKQEKAGTRDILRFRVDRPSYYYVPPFHVEVFFRGQIVQAWGFHGYGGCK